MIMSQSLWYRLTTGQHFFEWEKVKNRLKFRLDNVDMYEQVESLVLRYFFEKCEGY